MLIKVGIPNIYLYRKKGIWRIITVLKCTDRGDDKMGHDIDMSEDYEAKIKELETLMDRYQMLSQWIDKVVDMDFNAPRQEMFKPKF